MFIYCHRITATLVFMEHVLNILFASTLRTLLIATIV